MPSKRLVGSDIAEAFHADHALRPAACGGRRGCPDTLHRIVQVHAFQVLRIPTTAFQFGRTWRRTPRAGPRGRTPPRRRGRCRCRRPPAICPPRARSDRRGARSGIRGSNPAPRCSRSPPSRRACGRAHMLIDSAIRSSDSCSVIFCRWLPGWKFSRSRPSSSHRCHLVEERARAIFRAVPSSGCPRLIR